MTEFTQRALKIIAGIPAGHVMTYGQIAALAGSPRAARQIVRILHSMSKKHKLPWHRVINAQGKIGLQDLDSSTLQKMALESEGIVVSAAGEIELERYQFHPHVVDEPVF
ncbi:MGMT family protein [Brevibacillus sp. BC25]|uniref:MGMT family protein n=1 Tax=Brevibacillus sp. BC25 TaxID=1144308 RepID=UPI0002713893|nr:MGMT family protein [Brevibacillus sp. BC25]EJL23014.1 putative methylated DNA-protein cysteine methyltransferase [Brevibacillus sp. BC25]